MGVFEFEACDPSGGRHKGRLDAESSSAAAGVLRARGWIVLAMRAASTSRNQSSAAGFGPVIAQRTWNPLSWLPPSGTDIELSLQQIASMLRSGMTLSAAMRTAAEQSSKPSMAKIWIEAGERIQSGATLADALQHSKRFPEFIIQLVKVGEASGTLDLVLTRGSEQLERARTLKWTLLNALMYPAIVFLMALGVAAYMLLSLIPKLQKFLAGRNKKLPAITQALLDISTWLHVYAPYIAVGTVAAIIAFLALRRWPPGRLFLDRWALRLPLIGGILRTGATASFARTLGMLLESGITLVTGLGILEGLLPNKALSQHVADVRESVIGGGTLSEPLTRARLFVPMLGRVTAVGESTGTLDVVLAETAVFHEKRLAASVRWLSAIVEPAIIVIVGGIVGFVYVAFFVALYSIAG